MPSIINSKAATAIVLIILGFLVYDITRLVPVVINNNAKIAKATNELETLKKAQVDERQAAFLKSNDYLERQARIKLNYKKPDESVVFIYKNQYATGAQKTVSPAKPITLSNWQKWWHYFIDRHGQ